MGNKQRIIEIIEVSVVEGGNCVQYHPTKEFNSIWWKMFALKTTFGIEQIPSAS